MADLVCNFLVIVGLLIMGSSCLPAGRLGWAMARAPHLSSRYAQITALTNLLGQTVVMEGVFLAKYLEVQL